MLLPYILFDRDGTLIRFEHYLVDPSKVELLPRVVPGLQLLQEYGFYFGMVTNQSVIGRGLATDKVVDEVNERVISLLAQNGIEFRFVLLCPHTPEDLCDCRKPQPGLGNIAIQEYGLSPNLSFMIGDTLSDIQFGHAIGCKSIQIGGEIDEEYRADYYAEDILMAANWISTEMKRD